METIISNGNTTLSTASGFYRVEAANLGCFSAAAGLALTTTRYIPFTPANAGNLLGVVLDFFTVNMTDRQVVVTLQENIVTVWTDVAGATVTLDTEDITGTVNGYRGQYITPCIIGTPTAITATANKYRWKVEHGTGTGTWYLRNSDGTNFFHATWCDNAVSFTNGDVLIAKDYVTIDQSATLGAVLGTGDTVNGVSAIICSNINNPLPADVAYLKWDDTPAASYTLTVGGSIVMSAYSGFRIGTSTNRIPISERAIVTFTAPTAGTATARFITNAGHASYTYGGLSSIFLYGEIPTYQITHLTSDAATGQKDLIVDDAVDWVAGDTLVIGKQNAQNQGDLTVYTIASVSGNTITLTANIASYIRRAGATVIKLNSHGVLIQNTGTYSSNVVPTLANLQVSGVDLYNQIFDTKGGVYYYYLAALSSTCRSQYLFQDVTHWSNTTSCSSLSIYAIPPDGVLMQRCYGFRQNQSQACLAYYANGHISGRLEIKDSAFLSQYASYVSSASNIRLTIENNSYENARASAPFFYMTGINGIFKNNKIWGSATVNGAVYVGSCINPTEISGNQYDNNVLALGFQGVANVKCFDEDSVFNSEYANTTDISVAVPDAFPDYIFDSAIGVATIDETYLPDMVVGGKFGFINAEGVANEDSMYSTYGKYVRTGYGIADTKVWTGTAFGVASAGQFAIRFRPISATDLLVYQDNYPNETTIGNCQNLNVMVSMRIKINSDVYYAGTHTKPTLRVTYDGGTEITAVATGTTDDQHLVVYFAPTTTIETIKIELEMATDATLTDAYVYLGEVVVNPPAGVVIDTTTISKWNLGSPLGTVRTFPSSENMLDAQLSNHQIAGSAGKQLKDGLTEDNFLALK